MAMAFGLVEPTDISLPGLDPALRGLRVAHVSDLHVRRHKPLHTRLINQLANMRVDLIAVTGDIMDRVGDEEPAAGVLRRLCERLHPPHGIYAVTGNHDTPGVREQTEGLPIRWLDNEAVDVEGLPLRVMGLAEGKGGAPDAVALAASRGAARVGDRLAVLLCHRPLGLAMAADLGVDLMLSGHTHGGQIRLPGKRALVNNSDLPLDRSAGMLRHRGTLCLISRGLGETTLPLRTFCKPHAPVYTLRSGSRPGKASDRFERVWSW